MIPLPPQQRFQVRPRLSGLAVVALVAVAIAVVYGLIVAVSFLAWLGGGR